MWLIRLQKFVTDYQRPALAVTVMTFHCRCRQLDALCNSLPFVGLGQLLFALQSEQNNTKLALSSFICLSYCYEFFPDATGT
jgi:hypothetical protein